MTSNSYYWLLVVFKLRYNNDFQFLKVYFNIKSIIVPVINTECADNYQTTAVKYLSHTHTHTHTHIIGVLTPEDFIGKVMISFL